ncbi:MAG: carbon-nitrogen hydrolase family protein [Vulcanimicrobiaceae bacterium]
MSFRLALGQLAVSGDKPGNLAKIADAADRAAAASARLLVCPEASMFHFGKPNEPLAPAAESLDGAFVTALRELASRYRLWILAGMFEKIDGDSRVHNTLVLLRDDGELHGIYRKIHLYDAFGYRESDRIAPGDGSTLSFDLDGIRFGALTCYDLRFPELARHLAREGAQALLLPTAWLAGPLKEMHLATLLRARAIENTVYIGAADQCPPGYSGCSVLYDPLGVAVVSLGEAPGIIAGDIDAARVDAARATNPSLANSRLDLYARWIERSAATPAR